MIRIPSGKAQVAMIRDPPSQVAGLKNNIPELNQSKEENYEYQHTFRKNQESETFINYGSVCSGVEAATLAWEPLGWKAKFFAEVEPFPAAVLCHRFGATRPLRPLDPSEAEDENGRKLRENWKRQIAELPSCGVIPNLGDFTKIKETDYDGKIDLLVGGTPCFPAGSLILTEFGYRPIEEIQVGDRVVTHLGRLRRVLATGSKVADNVGRCGVDGVSEFSVTGNHPFWICANEHQEPEFRAIAAAVGLYAGQLKDAPIPRAADAESSGHTYCKDRWIFRKINYFHPTGISEIVYNLEVEDDHTYIANGICVHNCQDLSVAGKRLGFNGKRSVLALDFVRLCFESGTRWLCWENVPAALSSQGGRDFARFISLLCGWEVPVPDGGWRKAGIVAAAPGCFGVAWRILDAQYTRVPEFPGAIPQRRKRLFLIGHLDGWRYPAKVLFDGEMCGGNTPPRRAKGQNAARTLTASTGGVSGKEQGATFIDDAGTPLNALCMAHGQANAEITEGNAPTLSCNHEAPVVSFYSQRKVESISPIADVSNTLTNGTCPGFTNAICYDARGNGNGETVNTITGNHAGHVNDYMPLVAFTANDNGRDCLSECSPTLRKGGETPADGGAIVPAIVESEPLAFIKNDAGGDQDGYWRGIFPTLRTEITPAIAYNVTFCDANGCRKDRPNGGLYVTETDAGKTVTAGGPNTEMLVVDPLETPIALDGDKIAKSERKGGSGLGVKQDGSMYTQTARDVHAVAYNEREPNVKCRATVRRLLPIETERLMGFPDHHTRIPWQGKPAEECPDSARYKACGNSMAVNVMAWLGHRIQAVEDTIKNQSSKETLCLNLK